MPNFSKQWLIDYERKRANQVGVARVHSGDSESAKRRTLDSGVPREEKSDNRFAIMFTVYARRPADWDGYCVKQIQDALVESRLLCSDAWDQLEGCVRSRKVHTEEEERTEVIIQPL